MINVTGNHFMTRQPAFDANILVYWGTTDEKRSGKKEKLMKHLQRERPGQDTLVKPNEINKTEVLVTDSYDLAQGFNTKGVNTVIHCGERPMQRDEGIVFLEGQGKFERITEILNTKFPFVPVPRTRKDKELIIHDKGFDMLNELAATIKQQAPDLYDRVDPNKHTKHLQKRIAQEGPNIAALVTTSADLAIMARNAGIQPVIFIAPHGKGIKSNSKGITVIDGRGDYYTKVIEALKDKEAKKDSKPSSFTDLTRRLK